MGWDGTERDRTSSPPSHLGHTLRNGQRMMLLFNHRHTLSLSGTCLLGCLLYPFTPSEGTEKPRKKVGCSLRFQDCPPHLSSDPLIHQSDGLSCSCHSSLLTPHSPPPCSSLAVPTKWAVRHFFSLKAFLVCIWIVGSFVLMLGETH